MNAVFDLMVEAIGWMLEWFWYQSKDSFMVKVIKTCFILAVLAGIAYVFSIS